MYRASAYRHDEDYSERIDVMTYTYTAEIELDEDIFTAKEYIDDLIKSAVDNLNSSKIEEVQEDENR